MLTIRAMSDGKGYSARHLEHNDYYAEGERVVGEWFGRGAELIGLGGVVMSEDFEAIRQGVDPSTKEFLRVRQSADRVAADGTKLAQGRSLYDFTISAPKSVSVITILGEDHRLIVAHQTAVRWYCESWRLTLPLGFDRVAPMRTAPLEIWSWPCIITTPAVSWTRNYTHTRSPRTYPSMAPRAGGRHFRRRTFMSAVLI